jgi:cellulose synthase operon protein YhjQ
MTAVYSLGGGVGTTTILGTLARVLSAEGERILLVDSAPQSMLGFFFNGDPSPEGVSLFTLSEGEGSERDSGGQVRIASRPVSAEPGRIEPADAWLWRCINQYGPEVDRILVDVSAPTTERSQQRMLASGSALVILVPDVRCVLGIARLMKMFTAQEQALGRPVNPHFLLNQFDAGVPFHVEIFDRLRQQLGSYLLPFHIPRADQIAEATAEGSTIVDFDPGCAAADAFLRLVNWVRDLPPVQPVNRFGPPQSW